MSVIGKGKAKMTPKEYLQQYRKLMTDIYLYEALKEEAVINVASLKSPAFGDKIQKSPENDPIGNLVIEIEKKIAKYNIQILRCKTQMFVIESQIDKIKEIDKDFSTILAYRYLVGLDWQQIADKMFMSLSKVTHLHGPALRKFEEMFENDLKNA